MIPKDFCIDFYQYMENKGFKIGQDMTYFDLQVIQAFEYFRQQKVDVAVIEVGIGGHTCSTNVIDPPLMAVITNIGLDHMEVLGNSKESILQHKLGIVKKGSRVLIGNSVDKVATEARCKDVGASLLSVQTYKNDSDFLMEIDDLVRMGADLIRDKFDYADGIENTIEKISMPCRMQIFTDEERYGHLGKIMLDVGHNEDAIRKVFSKIRSMRNPESKRKWAIVFGCKPSKDVKAIWDTYAENSDLIDVIYLSRILTQENGYLLAERVKGANESLESPLNVDMTPRSVIENLHKLVDDKHQQYEGVLVHGSFHLMSDALEFLRVEGESDEVDMNDTYRIN